MPTITVPLEDEVGDVLDKAMLWAGVSIEQLAEKTKISSTRILDAIDYRSDLTGSELGQLANALHLNEIGLCALSDQCYPIPSCPGLPFTVHALRMSHGVGVVNAYVVSESGSNRGILFDAGPDLPALLQNWPSTITHLDAVFLTHIEGEHTGGLCDVVDYFGVSGAYVPVGCHAPCGDTLGEGESKDLNHLTVKALGTPGHSSAHNCYLVSAEHSSSSTVELLIAGDLIFAGSVGGSYFCEKLHQEHVQRVVRGCSKRTVVAPGHGPITTIGNELKFNPFLS